jgi:hypothetical protein
MRNHAKVRRLQKSSKTVAVEVAGEGKTKAARNVDKTVDKTVVKTVVRIAANAADKIADKFSRWANISDLAAII